MTRPLPISFFELDVRWLKREGYLADGTPRPVERRINGERAGVALVTNHGDRIAIAYKQRGRLRRDFAELTYTQPHLGGERVWFLCPSCERRVAILYGGPFRCRTCWGISYQSQRDAPMMRNIRREQKYRMRVGGSENLVEPFPVRPKGMHRRTYLRIRAKATRLERQRYGALAALLIRGPG